jgi:hypothetical protein
MNLTNIDGYYNTIKYVLSEGDSINMKCDSCSSDSVGGRRIDLVYGDLVKWSSGAGSTTVDHTELNNCQHISVLFCSNCLIKNMTLLRF